jgi:3-phenylpropionate/trans-cinnamate dioxygenase ferredoxin component
LARFVIATIDEMEAETAKKVIVDGEEICLVRGEDGQFYAVSDICSHEDYSLSEGEVWGIEIECPKHGSRFDLMTGEPRGLPATHPVKTYPVVLEGEEVLVEL